MKITVQKISRVARETWNRTVFHEFEEHILYLPYDRTVLQTYFDPIGWKNFMQPIIQFGNFSTKLWNWFLLHKKDHAFILAHVNGCLQYLIYKKFPSKYEKYYSTSFKNSKVWLCFSYLYTQTSLQITKTRKPSLLENAAYGIYEKKRTYTSIPNCRSISHGKLIEKRYFCNADRHCA